MKTETKWTPIRRSGSRAQGYVSQQYLKAGVFGVARWLGNMCGACEDGLWYVVFARDAYPVSFRGFRTAAEARAMAEKQHALATA